jgi:hypothetical protein
VIVADHSDRALDRSGLPMVILWGGGHIFDKLRCVIVLRTTILVAAVEVLYFDSPTAPETGIENAVMLGNQLAEQ